MRSRHDVKPSLPGLRTIDIRDRAAVDVLARPECGGVFEVIRRIGRPVPAAQVAEACSMSLGNAVSAIDALVSVGLLEAVRPRAPRRVVAFRATCSRIVVIFDSRDAGESAEVLRLQRLATRDAEEALMRNAVPPIDGVKGSAWHQTRIKCHLRPEHLKGLGQRLHAVGEYLMQVALEESRDDQASAPLCNFVVGLNLVPLEVPLLPSAPIVAVPRSAQHAAIASEPSTRFAGLSVRERQVAVALRDGRTRVEIAQDLGISPNTVGTVIRKLYSKLGVHRRAELVTRLSGIAGG